MKDFHGEIVKFYERLEQGRPFCLNRFGDGEWLAIQGIPTAIVGGEWTYEPSPAHEHARQQLIEAFRYTDPNYHVGILCPHCLKQPTLHTAMREFAQQPDEQLTYATVFVNANYSYFLEHYIPWLQQRSNIILVSNANSNLENFPIVFRHWYPVQYNAWVKDQQLIESFLVAGHQNQIVLISAGPFGKILAHQWWTRNPQNIYLDVGSTLDKWLRNDANARPYLTGADQNTRCHWSTT